MGRATTPNIVQVNIYGLTLAEILQKGADIPYWLSTFGIKNCAVFEVPRPTSCNRLAHHHEISVCWQDRFLTFSSISSFDCDCRGCNDDNLESIIKVEVDSRETPKPLPIITSTPKPNKQVSDNLFNCSLSTINQNDLTADGNNFDSQHLDSIYEENEKIIDSLSDSVIDVVHYILNAVEISVAQASKNTDHDTMDIDNDLADDSHLIVAKSQDHSLLESSLGFKSSSTAFRSISDDTSNAYNDSNVEDSHKTVPCVLFERPSTNSSTIKEIQHDCEDLLSSPVKPSLSFQENKIKICGEQNDDENRNSNDDYEILECRFPGCYVTMKWNRSIGRQRLFNHAKLHQKNPIKMKCMRCSYTHIHRNAVRRHHKKKHGTKIWLGSSELASPEDCRDLMNTFEICFPGWHAKHKSQRKKARYELQSN